MARTPAQLEAANKLFDRGLNVDGTPLTEQQKQSVAGLKRQGLNPAQTLLAEPQQPGALARFGAGAATPALGLLQTLQQQAAPLQQLPFVAKPSIDIAALRQRLPQPTGLAGFLGQAVGTGPLFALPEAAAARMPSLLGRLLARGAGGAGIGAGISPQHPLLGGALGGLTSVGIGAIPGAFRGLFGSGVSKKLARTTLDEISEGIHGGRPATAIQDNAQSAATQIRDLHTDLMKDYEGQIGNVMNQHGDIDIDTPQFDDLKKSISKFGRGNTKKALARFEEDPNLLHAHNLQSTIGANTRAVVPKDFEQLSQLDELNEARDALKGDINNSLDAVDPTKTASQQYVGASDFFRDKIVPFDERPGLKDIAAGKVTTPTNLTKIFANPNDKILSILDKLPPSFRNKILYETLGRNQKTINPRRLITAIDGLDQKGLAQHYLPEDIANARDIIESNIGHEKGVVPKIIKGGLIRIPEWLIAGTALRMGLPHLLASREETGL